MNPKLPSYLTEFFAAMQSRRYRVSVACFSERTWGLRRCSQLLEMQERLNKDKLRQLWLGENSPEQLGENWHQTPACKANAHLGEEFDTVIYQGHDGFDPNALGAITGTINAAGLFVLLLPAPDELQHFDDPEKKRICSWPQQPSQLSNRFLLRLYRELSHCPNVLIETQDQGTVLQTSLTEALLTTSKLEDNYCKTTDQAQAVEAIMHVASGHRRRPLVIYADRGRGKSASLGIAAAQLLLCQKDIKHILVTAPKPGATNTLFEHATRVFTTQAKIRHKQGCLQIENTDKQLAFLAPDVICREVPRCHLLIVDEAAAIPTPLLESMLRHYPRIVFATTVHGYEGNGRGFAIRFEQYLNIHTPQWHKLILQTPIRYPINDPLERAVNHCLLMESTNASLSRARLLDTEDNTLCLQQCRFEQLSQEQLLQDEATLAQVFSLLVLAHYQTQPRDLRFILDTEDTRVYLLRNGQRVLAVCLCQQEGRLTEELTRSIYDNTRRVQGHMLPQTLCAFSGLRSATSLSFIRIIRIAVHPEHQRKGLASRLLNEIEQRLQQTDLLGANFGYSPDLLQFWSQQGFQAVHLGYTASAGSGAHALTVLKACSDSGANIKQQAQAQFARQFPHLLSDRFKDLDSLCALSLLGFCRTDIPAPEPAMLQRLTEFAANHQGIDGCYHELQQLLLHKADKLYSLPSINQQQKQLLLCKLLQKHSWQQCCQRLGIDGKKQALSQLRQAILFLLKTT